MGSERDYVRLIDSAPRVECSRCHAEMTMRTLFPVPDTNKYTATFRCSKCGLDSHCEFTAILEDR